MYWNITINEVTKSVHKKKAGLANVFPEYYSGFELDGDNEYIPVSKPPEEIQDIKDLALRDSTAVNKSNEVGLERDRRINELNGGDDSHGRVHKKRSMQDRRAAKILRKQDGSTSSPEEDAELIALEAEFDAQEAKWDTEESINEARDEAVEWLADESRTLVEVQEYDTVADPSWP